VTDDTDREATGKLPDTTDTQELKAGKSGRKLWPRVLAILFAIGISVAIVLMGNRMEEFARFGLPGAFIISLLGNATLILPAPSLAIVVALGATLPPLQVGLVAGLGGALGELTGYMAGYAGSAVVEDREKYERIHEYMRKYGVIPILVLAIIPNPFFDLAGIAAGTLKMPIWQFLVACFIGKAIKMIAFAYAGAGSISAFSALFEKFL
jgi:membrane protein YqaA with SNARE-associated domain